MTKDWPLAAVWLFFLSGALMRGGFLYWLGLRIRRVDRGRGAKSEMPILARAEAAVRRFGAPVVTLSFLTVGVQSAVNLSAGLLRMPPRRFVPALLVGAMIWATIYVTIGMAVVYAFLGRLDWPLVVAGLLGLLLLVVATVLARRRLTPRDQAPPEDAEATPSP